MFRKVYFFLLGFFFFFSFGNFDRYLDLLGIGYLVWSEICFEENYNNEVGRVEEEDSGGFYLVVISLLAQFLRATNLLVDSLLNFAWRGCSFQVFHDK